MAQLPSVSEILVSKDDYLKKEEDLSQVSLPISQLPKLSLPAFNGNHQNHHKRQSQDYSFDKRVSVSSSVDPLSRNPSQFSAKDVRPNDKRPSDSTPTAFENLPDRHGTRLSDSNLETKDCGPDVEPEDRKVTYHQPYPIDYFHYYPYQYYYGPVYDPNYMTQPPVHQMSPNHTPTQLPHPSHALPHTRPGPIPIPAPPPPAAPAPTAAPAHFSSPAIATSGTPGPPGPGPPPGHPHTHPHTHPHAHPHAHPPGPMQIPVTTLQDSIHPNIHPPHILPNGMVPTSLPIVPGLANGSLSGPLPPGAIPGPLPPMNWNMEENHALLNKRKIIKRRTRTGCLTCRKRRIKCDERKPHCFNCERSRKVCLGYENLKRRDDGDEKNEKNDHSNQDLENHDDNDDEDH